MKNQTTLIKKQLLLIADVDELGRSGDVVSVKPGYARNFLLPQKKAVIASPVTVKLQEKLKTERAKQAEMDKEESEALSRKMDGIVLSMTVKVDPDGHMYGSVSASDIVQVLALQGFTLDKKNVQLLHPIKTLGVHQVSLKLKEGVPVQISLQIESDLPLRGQTASTDASRV